MWTPCITDITPQGYAAQSAPALNSSIEYMVNEPLSIYCVHGKRGKLYRFGKRSANPDYIISASGHILSRAYLESEAPLETWSQSEFVWKLLLDSTTPSRIHGVYVRATKEIIYGVHFGSIEEHFSGLLYIDDKTSIQVKDIETRVNTRNAHEICAFTGAPQAIKNSVMARFKDYLDSINPALKQAVKAIVPKKRRKV